jgi:hypothetical protein
MDSAFILSEKPVSAIDERPVNMNIVAAGMETFTAAPSGCNDRD